MKKMLAVILALTLTPTAAAGAQEWDVQFRSRSLVYVTPTDSAEVSYRELVAPPPGADPWHDDNIQLALMMMQDPPAPPELVDPDSLLQVISELAATLDQAGQELAQREAELQAQALQLAEAQEAIAARDARIAELEAEAAPIAELQARVTELEARDQALSDVIDFAIEQARAAMQRFRANNP